MATGGFFVMRTLLLALVMVLGSVTVAAGAIVAIVVTGGAFNAGVKDGPELAPYRPQELQDSTPGVRAGLGKVGLWQEPWWQTQQSQPHLLSGWPANSVSGCFKKKAPI